MSESQYVCAACKQTPTHIERTLCLDSIVSTATICDDCCVCNKRLSESMKAMFEADRASFTVSDVLPLVGGEKRTVKRIADVIFGCRNGDVEWQFPDAHRIAVRVYEMLADGND